MKALVFDRFGSADVLEYREIPNPEVRPGQIIVRMKAIGLNFADVYRRKGNYHLVGQPPFILGYEGAGVVEVVGEGVTDFAPGDRVAFADVPHANAELVAVPVTHAIPLPVDISMETAAGVLLQGLTAQYLARDSFRIERGHDVLVHAAAGGVGQLLVQIAKLSGARVLGLTSSEAKQAAALAAGADAMALYSENWPKLAAEFSLSGQGVDAAYDSVGSTLMDTFAAVKPTGTVVFFGMAGGDPAPVDPRMLMDTSKTLTGGDLWSYLVSKEERVRRAEELFGWIRTGQLRLPAATTYTLADGAEAHRFLESRQSMGKILLIP